MVESVPVGAMVRSCEFLSPNFLTSSMVSSDAFSWMISFDDHDLITNFTAVAATINNIGPGLNLVGPTGNFAFFSIPSKLVLIFDMLAGRLELFPMLVLFAPGTWRK